MPTKSSLEEPNNYDTVIWSKGDYLQSKTLYLEYLRSLNNGPESVADQSPCTFFKTIIIQKSTITVLLYKRYIEGISFYSLWYHF